MLRTQIAAAIGCARASALDEIMREVWTRYSAGQLTEEDAGQLSTLAHERREADAGSHVVVEGEEGGRVGTDAAVQRHAVRDGPHGVLADPEVEVALREVLRGDVATALDGGPIGAREVGAAAEQLGQLHPPCRRVISPPAPLQYLSQGAAAAEAEEVVLLPAHMNARAELAVLMASRLRRLCMCRPISTLAET